MKATNEEIARLQEWLAGRGWISSIHIEQSYLRKSREWSARIHIRKLDPRAPGGCASARDLSAPPSIRCLREIAAKAIASWHECAAEIEAEAVEEMGGTK